MRRGEEGGEETREGRPKTFFLRRRFSASCLGPSISGVQYLQQTFGLVNRRAVGDSTPPRRCPIHCWRCAFVRPICSRTGNGTRRPMSERGALAGGRGGGDWNAVCWTRGGVGCGGFGSTGCGNSQFRAARGRAVELLLTWFVLAGSGWDLNGFIYSKLTMNDSMDRTDDRIDRYGSHDSQYKVPMPGLAYTPVVSRGIN